MPEFLGMMPTFAVNEIGPAAAHYRRLGFTVQVLGKTNVVARRDAVAITLAEHGDSSFGVARELIIFVRDISALREEWAVEKVGGQIDETLGEHIRDAGGLFTHIDPDGNRLIMMPPVDFDADTEEST